MKIKFVPTGQEIDIDPNKSLLQLCTENQIEIRSICKGVPSCAECRVRVVSGENNVLPPNHAELSLIGSSYFLDGRRLSCQVRCFGNITVDLTEQIERQDNPNKKVRGFRSAQKTVETQAVQGTLVLEEKPVVQSQPQQQPQRQGQGPDNRGGGQGGGGGKSEGGGGGRNRRGRNRRGGGGGGAGQGGGGGQGGNRPKG